MGCRYLDGTECSVWKDLLDVAKGCLIWPESAEQIVDFPGCGLKFEAVK